MCIHFFLFVCVLSFWGKKKSLCIMVDTHWFCSFGLKLEDVMAILMLRLESFCIKRELDCVGASGNSKQICHRKNA